VALFRRRHRRGSDGDEGGSGGKVDWLVVGLGNPGDGYERTRHNVGFEVARLAAERWGLARAKKKYGGLYIDGRTGPGGPRVAVLLPQTFMNESGRSVGPARGALGVPLDRVVAVHDEIDLPFGRVEARLGGGLAGHNGLKSLRAGLGSPDFRRIRVGVGRPHTTDPEIVSAHVLGRFAEPKEEVRALVERAADELERLVREPDAVD
jgi:peptidyl-tRNA hydrolase, PTH1 family